MEKICPSPQPTNVANLKGLRIRLLQDWFARLGSGGINGVEGADATLPRKRYKDRRIGKPWMSTGNRYFTPDWICVDSGCNYCLSSDQILVKNRLFYSSNSSFRQKFSLLIQIAAIDAAVASKLSLVAVLSRTQRHSVIPPRSAIPPHRAMRL